MVFNLVVADNTISSCFTQTSNVNQFFYIFYCRTPNPREAPIKKAKVEIEVQPITTENKVSSCSL